MMQFIKTHLVSLLSGVAAIAFVALAVIGMTSDKVVKDMNKRIATVGGTEIAGLRSRATNENVIEEVRKEGERKTELYNEALQTARQIDKRTPMMNDVFPRPSSPVRAVQFREQYREYVAELPGKLQAGTAPTQADVDAQKTEVIELRQEEEAREKEGEAPLLPVVGSNQETGAGIMPGGATVFGGPSGNDRQTQAFGDIPKGEPKYDPELRARVEKAHQIRCYISPETFQVSPIVATEMPPSAEELWYAQMGMWVQNDIINAINELNDAAAKAAGIGDDGLPPAVEQMPIKRIVRLRVSGYQTDRGLIPFQSYVMSTGSGGAGPQPMASGGGSGGGVDQSFTPVTSFTGRVCNADYDVVKFGLSLVMDQRRILDFVDTITRLGFYQCVGIRFDAIDRAAEATQGYLYGPDPVVLVRLDFEGYFARDNYKDMMPETVLARLEGQNP